jgi:TPP-dependent pyruvate/acetoin dehydrogenase alpha subunit
MNETRTTSILQRVPAILAVTANSYGLSLQAARTRRPEAHGERRQHAGRKAGDKPAAHR